MPTDCAVVRRGCGLHVLNAKSVQGMACDSSWCDVDLLIRQCQKTGTTDYDTLTYAVGGPIWRVRAPLHLLCPARRPSSGWFIWMFHLDGPSGWWLDLDLEGEGLPHSCCHWGVAAPFAGSVPCLPWCGWKNVKQ